MRLTSRRTASGSRNWTAASLVGNWILQLYEGAFTHKVRELDSLLKRTGLHSADDSASTIFSQIVNLFRRLTNPKAAEVAATITADGLPVIAPKIEFGDAPGVEYLVRHDDALRLLNDVLDEAGRATWVPGSSRTRPGWVRWCLTRFRRRRRIVDGGHRDDVQIASANTRGGQRDRTDPPAGPPA